MIPTVTTYSEELAEIITMKLAESSARSQSLDRTFPRRVVDPNIKKRKITERELRDKLTALEQKRLDLMKAGLLDQSSDPVQVEQIDPSTNIVLSVYIEDTEQKLGIFDELANKIELLKRIINKRLLYKTMTINRQDGFVFTTSKGAIIPLENLSSGEQHALVLFYELLFNAAPGSLILIDEPEISLHIGWQQQFLEDIQEITPLTNIDLLMATHSPEIINNRWDLTVSLEGPQQ
jgi:predicted ATP-binding protein involved in virulence